ncbi:MAG: copper resistance D family protein [Gemmatimonadaceae bacterium]
MLLSLLQTEPYQIPWGDLALDYVGFLAYFAMFGALGFFFVVLRGMSPHLVTTTGREASTIAGISAAAERAGARIGLVGAILFLGDLLVNIAATAADKQIGFLDAIQRGGSRLMSPLVFGALLLLSFLMAMRLVRAGWIAALVAGLALALRSITTGKWASLVNPVHELSASVWLGTLLVLVIAGLPAILRSQLPSERRGALVAELVARFSPLALCAASLLGITGVITAWRHLKFVAALWTTSYGYALDLKLIVVGIVLSLGAWNWRRMSPRLGSEGAAHQLRRSAKAELAFAAVVLAITAVLVSLPSPKLPH